jgi:nitroreductase
MGATRTQRADVLAALLGERHSCRGFLPDPIPRERIEALLDLARQAPSWCNTQPWHVHLVTGDTTRRFAASLTAHARAHAQRPDLPPPDGYSGVYRDRRREAGFALYASLGIGREDADARVAQRMRNFSFFGAPHVAVITTDREQGVYGAVDCGGYVATLIHAAHSLGIATIPQAAIAMYSDHVREFLGITDDRAVVCAVSLGYSAHDAPVNGFRTTRAALTDAVTVVDR